MFRAEAKTKIAEELSRGAQARSQGLEGRARVCARRAAGAAVREYLELNGQIMPGPSAYDLLAHLLEQPGISAEVRQVIEHLLARVDENYALPEGMDLLAETEWLVRELESQT